MLPDSFWVLSKRVLAGEHPAGSDRGLTRSRLAALLERGIRTFIDLTKPDEREPYDELLIEEASARDLRVAYHRVEIRDHDVPTLERMTTILGLIDEALERDAPVYVHCWAGIGRTGTVVGCWLTARGRSADQALQEIARLRRRTVYYDVRSPETDDQVAFVRAWPAPGEGEAQE